MQTLTRSPPPIPLFLGLGLTDVHRPVRVWRFEERAAEAGADFQAIPGQVKCVVRVMLRGVSSPRVVLALCWLANVYDPRPAG